MKIFFPLFFLISTLAIAQDPRAYLSSFDSKIYSLKTRGVKDFVVDIESSKLTKQMNDEMTFGKIDKLIFRTYWTNNPERLSIEVIGLPEGFKEIKEELKGSILAVVDSLLPVGMVDKFAGYKIATGGGPKEFIARDQSGIAPIPSFILKFDANDSLTEVIGNKPVGSFKVKTEYEKESFSDGKWVLKSQVTTAEENGQTMTTTRELDYDKVQGIGVLEEVKITVVQKFDKPDSKSIESSDTLEFKNYKINAGEGLKYFLGDTAKK